MLQGHALFDFGANCTRNSTITSTHAYTRLHTQTTTMLATTLATRSRGVRILGLVLGLLVRDRLL